MDNCTRQCRNFDIGREILKSEKMNSLFWIYNLKLEGCRKEKITHFEETIPPSKN